jgi:hypothetical protein
MPGILALRKRMPLIVFLLLALLVLMLVGLACACLTDNPMQAIERVLTALAQLPTVAVAWTFVFASLVLALPRLQPHAAGSGRASPAALQRFLFCLRRHTAASPPDLALPPEARSEGDDSVQSQAGTESP